MKPVFGRVENPTRAFLLIHEKRVPSPRFLWHFHNVYELNLVVSGAGTRFVGDHIGHFEAGDVVLMGPHLPHTWCGDGGVATKRRGGIYQAVAVQFADGFLGESLPSDPEWHHVRGLLARASRGISFGGAARDTVRQRMIDLSTSSGPAKLMAFWGFWNCSRPQTQTATNCSRVSITCRCYPARAKSGSMASAPTSTSTTPKKSRTGCGRHRRDGDGGFQPVLQADDGQDVHGLRHRIAPRARLPVVD